MQRLTLLGCHAKDLQQHLRIYDLGKKENGIVKAKYKEQRMGKKDVMVVTMDLLGLSLEDAAPETEGVSS